MLLIPVLELGGLNNEAATCRHLSYGEQQLSGLFVHSAASPVSSARLLISVMQETVDKYGNNNWQDGISFGIRWVKKN